MEIIELPGFNDCVHDAQKTFRILLNALSHPGTAQKISVQLTPPSGLTLACAAACLTLLDLDTTVWLSSELGSGVKSWLKFHAGCRFTDDPKGANFAVIQNIKNWQSLDNFNWGTAEEPERSTTLFVQVEALETGEFFRLNGPGIDGEWAVKLPLSSEFLREWEENRRSYPLGVDVFLFAENAVIGLPRTANLSL